MMIKRHFYKAFKFQTFWLDALITDLELKHKDAYEIWIEFHPPDDFDYTYKTGNYGIKQS